MKFRKKPVVIEATQWFKMGDHPKVYPATPRDFETWYADLVGVKSKDLGMIDTLEGPHYVTPGDWISLAGVGAGWVTAIVAVVLAARTIHRRIRR